MRIYIVGSVASGKTTLLMRLSETIDIPSYHLDEVVHIKDLTNKKWGNIRRSDEQINQLFNEIINIPNWIVEEAGRKIFHEGFETADIIILLEPNILIKLVRVFTRYIKQKLGAEGCLYRPSLRMLFFMYNAIYNYEIGKDDLKERLRVHSHKVVVLKNKAEINNFIRDIKL